MRGQTYQILLIALSFVALAFFGVFFYRELYPEYRIYQGAYIALERFRSELTGEPPPLFREQVKQIVLDDGSKGPVEIDRCISCHVALTLPHFSPVKIAQDINGNPLLDEEGLPVLVENEDYIWRQLDQAIENYEKEGDFVRAAELSRLKTAEVSGLTFDMEKVLQAHPLIGRETRPFEFHPMEEVGCVSCHSGNGRGLTTIRAHGPVFDGQYKKEFMGYVPQFLERDPENDPRFASAYNGKPGHDLLFQTTPLFVESLIQAKCMQCHETSADLVTEAFKTKKLALDRAEANTKQIEEGFKNEKASLESLRRLYRVVQKDGFASLIDTLNRIQEDFSLPREEREQAASQESMLKGVDQEEIGPFLVQKVNQSFEDPTLSEKFLESDEPVDQFLLQTKESPLAIGPIYVKMDALLEREELMKSLQEKTVDSFALLEDQKAKRALLSDIDFLTSNYQRGQELFISQACYACHRIAGFARGGIGPELSEEGNGYPWFIKESMVWPQADLPTSTMPNYRLDHRELEDLMTYLLAQTGRRRRDGETRHKQFIQRWEAGEKLPFEKAIDPALIRDVSASMKVFAKEGCAACHRLKGFDTSVGFTVSQDQPDYQETKEARKRFKALFPEDGTGSFFVQSLLEHKEEIDALIREGVHKKGVLDELEEESPGLILSFYEPFAFAQRAQNSHYLRLYESAKTNEERLQAKEGLKDYQARVTRVLLLFAKEYGLGRLIGPRPNWSGVTRSDKWLMQHFHNPQSTVARSIMPVLPFDDTKFYALTYMLDMLGKQNRDEVREIWIHEGFDPKQAYDIFCSQCHGDNLHGNGPVAEWIYPIPKNLRSSEFMRHLGKERTINSIVHGIKGGPMPPWGETHDKKPFDDQIPVMTKQEIELLVDWIFSTLPGGKTPGDETEIKKWQYGPSEIMEELQREGSELMHQNDQAIKRLFGPEGTNIVASLQPEKKGQDAIFEAKENPEGVPEKLYFIKEKYYTEENLREGGALFHLHCAVCHGLEADGGGVRAETMWDARPRMLTNIDWSKTRDDLRFLQSIKFGVRGTSMQPWGDQTNALQRLQLVMYIRELARVSKLRSTFQDTLYDVFVLPEQSLLLYKGSVQDETKQEFLEEMIASLQKEKESFENLMGQILLMEAFPEIFDEAHNLLQSMKGRVELQGESVSFNDVGIKEGDLENLLENIEVLIQKTDATIVLLRGRIASSQRDEEIKDLKEQKESLESVKGRIQETVFLSKRELERQKMLWSKIQKQGNQGT